MKNQSHDLYFNHGHYFKIFSLYFHYILAFSHGCNYFNYLHILYYFDVSRFPMFNLQASTFRPYPQTKAALISTERGSLIRCQPSTTVIILCNAHLIFALYSLFVFRWNVAKSAVTRRSVSESAVTRKSDMGAGGFRVRWLWWVGRCHY